VRQRPGVRRFMVKKNFNPNSEVGLRPARSGFPTCWIADFQVGGAHVSRNAQQRPPPAGWETRDTADLEVCATNSASEFGFKVFYRVQLESRTVEVLRCWDGRREADPLL